jgi:hypothetical protein
MLLHILYVLLVNFLLYKFIHITLDIVLLVLREVRVTDGKYTSGLFAQPELDIISSIL